MKKLFLFICSLIAFAELAKATPPAQDKYYMANKTRIVNAYYGATYTELTLAYEIECNAKLVDTVDKVDIIGNPGDPSSSFKIAVGVLLVGNPMKPCYDDSPSATMQEVKLRLNSTAVEGVFAGFEIIQGHHQCRGHHNCPHPTPSPTETPYPTYPPMPTHTSMPTSTPIPTSTPMPPCHGHHCPRPTGTPVPFGF